MALIALETSTETGSVALAHQGEVLAYIEFSQPNAHGRNLATAVGQCLLLAGMQMAQISAVAISAGPGSYTGLRIGASLAKGLCFGLGVPLVPVGTLAAMAAQVVRRGMAEGALLCPMLDARRMEVYTATYTPELKVRFAPSPVIMDEHPLMGSLDDEQPVLYFGPGADKCRPILAARDNFTFVPAIVPSAREVAQLALKALANGQTSPAATFEPDYLKAFQGTKPKDRTATQAKN